MQDPVKFYNTIGVIIKLGFAIVLIIGSLTFLPVPSYGSLFSRKEGIVAVILTLIPPVSVILLICIRSFLKKFGNFTMVLITYIITFICTFIVGLQPGVPKGQEEVLFLVESIMLYLPALAMWAGITLLISTLRKTGWIAKINTRKPPA